MRPGGSMGQGELGRFEGDVAKGLMVYLLPNIWLRTQALPPRRWASYNLPGARFPYCKKEIIVLSSYYGCDFSVKSYKLFV